jgi:hypothetical protein
MATNIVKKIPSPFPSHPWMIMLVELEWFCFSSDSLLLQLPQLIRRETVFESSLSLASRFSVK